MTSDINATSRPMIQVESIIESIQMSKNLLLLIITNYYSTSVSSSSEFVGTPSPSSTRSEERRVGKECLRLCRSR